ncbi:hypothetical protein OF83DRAFT_1098154 [Amylostereum chailletii]|nr:hypothetical protein OF83DRAFT_1098154 [Amylostereum chailletii]
MSTPSSPAHSSSSSKELPHRDLDVEELQSDEAVQTCLRDADELKQEGNDHFRSQRWNEALASYKSGLGRLPRRKQHAFDGKGKEKADPPGMDDPTPQTGIEEETQKAEPVRPLLTPLEVECAKTRAILNANIGACFMKQVCLRVTHVRLILNVHQNEYAEAVKACSDAILDDPDYAKAIQRRAQANEKIGSWSALSSAQDGEISYLQPDVISDPRTVDYKQLLDILPPAAASQIEEVKRALRAIQPRVEAAQKREMDEMVGKLKGFGNSILGRCIRRLTMLETLTPSPGKFGMSTDNFKFEPNGQGGYSMNFVR